MSLSRVRKWELSGAQEQWPEARTVLRPLCFSAIVRSYVCTWEPGTGHRVLGLLSPVLAVTEVLTPIKNPLWPSTAGRAAVRLRG